MTIDIDMEMGQEIITRAVGRRKEAVAQIKVISGTGNFIINNKPAKDYLHDNSCSLISIKAPFTALEKRETKTIQSKPPSLMLSLDSFDLIITVRGGGLVGQAEAIKLGVARALCQMEALALDSTESPAQHEVRRQLKAKGYLTQDSRVKERRKYGLKKARKASQYHKR
jgi:small subunit ribosomal protein S9